MDPHRNLIDGRFAHVDGGADGRHGVYEYTQTHVAYIQT